MNLLREYLSIAIRVEFPPLPSDGYGGVDTAAMEDIIEWVDDAGEDAGINATAIGYWPGPN